MSEFTVFIPTLPPTSNHAYGVAVNKRGKGFIYMTAEGKAWKTGAQLAVQAADNQPEGFWKGKQLFVSLTFFYKSTLIHDIDGLVKLALDSVADGLGFDDRYVFPLLLNKKPSTVYGISVFVTDRIPHDVPAALQPPDVIGELGSPLADAVELLPFGDPLYFEEEGE